MPRKLVNVKYSEIYEDSKFEYRHVVLPKHMVSELPTNGNELRLMTQREWRALGVCQSPDWVHYMFHEPEPHVLLFRRPLSKKASESSE